jgi:hypothetical protein
MQEDLFDTLPSQLDIPSSSSIYTQAMQNYDANLRRIVRFCGEAGVPLLVVPVQCNLRDQSPMMSSWPEAIRKGRGRWNSLMSEASDLMELRRNMLHPDIGSGSACRKWSSSTKRIGNSL